MLHDFVPYPSANNQYLAFVTVPVIVAEKTIGMIVASLLPEKINAIIQGDEDNTLQTEESYLIGELGGKTSYRSDRIVKKSEKNTFGQEKIGEDISKALAGESGVLVKTGSTGQLEFSNYVPLNIPGLKWALLITTEVEEILVSIANHERNNFFDRYIQTYGYYDLFLIHPQGQIFYTVRQESDYQTNILTGEYADSGLGHLIKQILATQNFGMSDYALYAPSHHEPAAFVAQPLLSGQLIVALQLNDAALNKIMSQRAGMGNTGESYLVGSDHLMRSNSFNNSQYSIKSSFANPTLYLVNTESVRAVLEKGETGMTVINDYRGISVLSAYTPLKINGTQWALLTEIDEAEVFTPIRKLQRKLIEFTTFAAFLIIEHIKFELSAALSLSGLAPFLYGRFI